MLCALERERQLREAQEGVIRRTRLGLIAASLLLLVAAGAGAYGWWQQGIAVSTAARLVVTNQDLKVAIQRTEAEAEKAKAAERKALSQESRALAALAQRETSAGNAVNAMLLALRGMPIAGGGNLGRSSPSRGRCWWMPCRPQESGWSCAVMRSGVNAAAFSPDGARIVSGSHDNTVRVWDAASGEELLVLRGHEKRVSAAAFSPDGARIVSGSDDDTVRVWDVASGAGPAGPARP